MYRNKIIQAGALLSFIIALGIACWPVSSYGEESDSTVTTVESTAEDIVTITRNAGYIVDDFYHPAASIVIDAESGQVLWEEQADLGWYPASIAKMMSVYLLFDEIAAGNIRLDTTVTATESDEAISQLPELSNSPITAGVAYPVSDLLYMTTLASSNAATVMLANLITNNDAAAFIKMMNSKAAKLGMDHTTFYNPSGASASSFEGHYAPKDIDPDADNVSTARDLALMFYHLLKDYPEVLTYTSSYQVTVMENTEYATVLTNSNLSIPGATFGYEGADGLKTGASPEGAYSYAATAKRNDLRLIEVILGVGQWDDPEGGNQRHSFGNALLDYGFNNFESKKLLSKGAQTINNQEIIVSQDFYGLVRKDVQPKYILSDNQQLLLSNGLSQVSSSIPAPSVAYQAAEKTPQEQAVENTTATSFADNIKQSKNEYIILGILLLIGAALMIFSGTRGNTDVQSRKGAAALRKNALIFGLLILILSVTGCFATFVLGPWLPF